MEYFKRENYQFTDGGVLCCFKKTQQSPSLKRPTKKPTLPVRLICELALLLQLWYLLPAILQVLSIAPVHFHVQSILAVLSLVLYWQSCYRFFRTDLLIEINQLLHMPVYKVPHSLLPIVLYHHQSVAQVQKPFH